MQLRLWSRIPSGHWGLGERLLQLHPSSREVEPAPRTSSPPPQSHLLGNGPWRAGMEAPTWLWAGRAGRGEQQSSGSITTSHEGPGVAVAPGTSPFPWDFISHHVLQGWRKLLKPWAVFSPPGSRNSCAQLPMNESPTTTTGTCFPPGIPSRARGAGG